MTTKLTFRARTLDSSKPMAIYHAEQLPELAEATNINRAVTSLPTGMEKEEETEKHLQDILEAQNKGLVQKDDLIIPTPEVLEQDQGIDALYKTDFKQPRQYIHVQPFSTGQDMPDYDMDEEDIKFFKEELKNRRKLEVSMITFEDMIDRLEKNSSQVVVTLKEAKLLLKEDDELILAVYDFWLNKRLEKQQSLMPVVRQERRDGTQLPSPYVAFRRRTEKMQTRKNRKNDEASYEAMLKLRRDLSTAVTLLEMVKRREKTKKEKLALNSEVFEKRYVLKDWEGKLITEILAAKPARVLQSYCNVPSWIGTIGSPQEASVITAKREKRVYKKRKRHRSGFSNRNPALGNLLRGERPVFPEIPSSDDDRLSDGGTGHSDLEVDNVSDEADSPFGFRRRRGVEYHAPVSPPWELTDTTYPLHLGAFPPLYGGPDKGLGACRRRMGRGGRVVLDRGVAGWADVSGAGACLATDKGTERWQDFWAGTGARQMEELERQVMRPVTPDALQDVDWDPYMIRSTEVPSNTRMNTKVPRGPLLGSPSRKRTASGAIKMVDMNAVVAHNAAGALVDSHFLDIFSLANRSPVTQ